MTAAISRRTFVSTSLVAGAAAGLGFPSIVRGQETTVLRTVSAWTEETAFSRAFERFIERVNETGEGVIQLNYLGGGAKVMNVFEMGQALRRGVFDVLNTNSAYYSSIMPESNAIKLTRVPMAELRENGTFEFLQSLTEQKMNAYFLGRGKGDVPFHVYLSDRAPRVEGPDFSALKLRVTPNYRAFFTALGASLVQTQGSEIYTSLERGVVDGYGWPIQGIDELGLVPVTRYRIDPGFFVAPNETLINLNVWNGLGEEQRQVLLEAQAWTESWLDEYEEEENEKAMQMQAEAGIEVIEFTGEDAEYYLNTAYEAAWEDVLEAAPENGPRLKELMETA